MSDEFVNNHDDDVGGDVGGEVVGKKKREKKVVPELLREWNPLSTWEIGVDEAGRGPLFGRLFVGGVVLPKPGVLCSDGEEFRYSWMKDSKKFTSHKKRKEVAKYIQEHSLAWHVAFVEPEEIDRINILQAVYQGMHECIQAIMKQLGDRGEFRLCNGNGWCEEAGVLLLIDGNRFEHISQWNSAIGRFEVLEHVCIEGGDNKVCAIAGASILAKTAHDDYIMGMCEVHPELNARYELLKGMGYATKRHLDGIRNHGITQWHRRSFGETCKNARFCPLSDLSSDLVSDAGNAKVGMK